MVCLPNKGSQMKHIPIIVVNWFMIAILLFNLVTAFHITSPVLALIIGLITGIAFYEILGSMLKTSDKYLK